MTGPTQTPSSDRVRVQLDRLTAGEALGASKRLQRFLAYIVEAKLEGRVDEIREYNIATSVYDRDPSFDPRTDTIVRVEARRLRQYLASYYSGPGAGDELIIEIPKGGYVPAFRIREGARAPSEIPAPARQAGAHRKWYAVAAVVIAATAITIAVQNGVRRYFRSPATWTITGSKLRILDRSGRICWEKTFPPFATSYDVEVRDKVVIADIDLDGRPEVLFSYAPATVAEDGGVLHCFERDGRPRWQHRFGKRKTFGGRTFDATYVGRFVRPVWSAGAPALLTVANHFIWHPSQTELLDPRTGRTIEEYWHPGWIYQCELRDFDQDGNLEVALGAINNPGQGLGHAALAMLTLPFSRAKRTIHPDPRFPPFAGGGELAYLVFPQPDINVAMGALPIPVRVEVDERRRILFQTPLWEMGGIVYYIDSSFRLEYHQPSDNFAALHERLYRQGILDHRLTEGETASLGRVLTLPAAPDGNHPAISRVWDVASR